MLQYSILKCGRIFLNVGFANVIYKGEKNAA